MGMRRPERSGGLHHRTLDDDAVADELHSATRSLRARATIAVFFPRPPARFTRSRNQTLSSDVGWFRSHSQASWTIMVRSLGFPALDRPCSCWTDPLCQGVGASPA